MSNKQQAFQDETMVEIDSDYKCPYLEYFYNGELRKVAIDNPSTIVGRLRDKVDYIVDDAKVSKVHAEFCFDGGKCFVKDCGSTHGTYINGSGQRIDDNVPYQIFNGDKIKLANIEMTLRCNRSETINCDN